jgi:hypothetical protein
MASDDAIGTETLSRRGKQNHLQLATVDGKLRPVIARGTSSRLRPDELAVLRVVGKFRGWNRRRGEPLGEAKLGQFTDRVRQGIDADAEWLDGPYAFEYAGLYADLMQAQRCRQASDAGADDQYGHGRSGRLPMPVYHTTAGTIETLEWGDGPDLFVLLYAAAAGPHSLSALAGLLLRPGRRVIAPALNRYGATVMRDETDRVRAHVDVLSACLDIHPADRRVVFGHSMGGLVGLLGALDGLAFDAMILYEPIATACLRDDVPVEAASCNWDRRIVAGGTSPRS